MNYTSKQCLLEKSRLPGQSQALKDFRSNPDMFLPLSIPFIFVLSSGDLGRMNQAVDSGLIQVFPLKDETINFAVKVGWDVK